MKVYLDNNILIYLEKGMLSINELEEILGHPIDKVFYSFSHIQEAREITGKYVEESHERLKLRFETIELYTNNNYIDTTVQGDFFQDIVPPKIIYEGLNEFSSVSSLMKIMVNFISEEERNAFRLLVGVNPKVMNNYSPTEVIEQISNEIAGTDGMNFLQLFEQAASFHKNLDTFKLSHKIGSLFEILDLLGYWKDTYTSKSNYARTLDAGHCFYASYCDYFITNDLKTYNKCKVAYELFDISTKPILQKPTKNINL